MSKVLSVNELAKTLKALHGAFKKEIDAGDYSWVAKYIQGLVDEGRLVKSSTNHTTSHQNPTQE